MNEEQKPNLDPASSLGATPSESEGAKSAGTPPIPSVSSNQPQKPPVSPTPAPSAGPSAPEKPSVSPSAPFGGAQVSGIPPVSPITPSVPAAAAPQAKPAKKVSPKKKKALMIGLLLFGFVFLIILFFVFIFLSQVGPEENPLLKLFGVEEKDFYPFLITLANVVFGLILFAAFIIALIGVFRLAMAKKDDVKGKKAGLVMTLIGGVLFMVFAFTWAGAYLYLDAKRSETAVEEKPLIVTEPKATIGLTAPVTIFFDASGIPVDTRRFKIISYLWDFGDGATATGPTVSHKYTSKGEEAGRYIVSLKITYRDLKTNEEKQDILTHDVVIINEKVNAEFTALPEKGEAPLKVSFDASESLDPDGEIIAYEWDLDGDGNYDDAQGEEAEYTFEKVGVYEVKLRVTDNSNDWDTAEMEIEVKQPNIPVAVVNVDSEEFFIGVNYTFDGSESESPNGNIAKYNWNFGDGTPVVNTRTAIHSFSEVGTFEVVLEVTDEIGEKAKNTLKITVVSEEAVPTAVITPTPDFADEEKTYLLGKAPFTVTFSGEDSTDPDNDIVDYQWDFDGDEVLDTTGAMVTYVFEEADEYITTLYVIDAANNQGKTSILVKVEPQGLTALLTVDPISGEVPLSVDFDASASTYPEGEIVSYRWDFGDGSGERIDVARVTYKYTTTGTFTAKVTTVASDGSQDTAEVDINVRPVSINACFTPNVDQGEAPLIVTFDPSCSTGTIAAYSWDFGDREVGRERKPTHTFENAGVYQVTLEIADSQNVVDSYTDTIVVTGILE